MAWKQVQNPTIIANLNDNVNLPTEVYALEIETNGEIRGWFLVPITKWEDINGNVVTTARTDKEGEYIYYGKISGYAHTVFCSVVVGDIEENPESEFPTDFRDVTEEDKPDEFGVPKQEVRTSDMPNIDDYQYLKSKKNRTTFESAQLQKLTELMASKIIMARDVNHVRNAIVNTQEFCLSLKRALDEVVTDGENIGSGEGEVYAGLVDNEDSFGKKMQFRTIKAGENINISTNGDEVEISAEVPEVELPEASSDFCGLKPIKARSYDTCGMFYKEIGGGANPEDGAYYRFGGSKYLGIKVRKAGQTGDAFSMLHVFGMGNGLPQMINAGRIFKGRRDFIIEMKTGENKYSGIHILGEREDGNAGKVKIYEQDDNSRIQTAIEKDQVDVDNELNPTNPSTTDSDVYGIGCACGE